MIYYDEEIEQWVDSEDDRFSVDMTPEGIGEGFPEFQNRADFWKYYSDDSNCPDFEKIQEFMEWYLKK